MHKKQIEGRARKTRHSKATISRQPSRQASKQNSRKNSLTQKQTKKKKAKGTNSLFNKGIFKYLNSKDSNASSRAQHDLARILINYNPTPKVKSSKPSTAKQAKRKKFK